MEDRLEVGLPLDEGAFHPEAFHHQGHPEEDRPSGARQEADHRASCRVLPVPEEAFHQEGPGLEYPVLAGAWAGGHLLEDFEGPAWGASYQKDS